MCMLYQFTSICVLLSWRAQVTLHQLLCDMGLWGIPWEACGGRVHTDVDSLAAMFLVS